jgi:DNA-binding NarL/FixJ family response regulator
MDTIIEDRTSSSNREDKASAQKVSGIERAETLTPRDREVLELLVMGLLYKEIGEKLNIGTETVRTHVKHICKKMEVRSRVDAVVKHIRGSIGKEVL